MNSNRVSAHLLCISPHSREPTVSSYWRVISFMSSLTLVLEIASIILWMKALRLSLGCWLMFVKDPTSMSWSPEAMNYLQNTDCSSFQLCMVPGANLFHQSSADMVRVSKKQRHLASSLTCTTCIIFLQLSKWVRGSVLP